MSESVANTGVSPKSRLSALLLVLFLGMVGAHRFYVGKIGTGILQVVTFGGFGIWMVIDAVLIAAGAFRDKEGRLVTVWQNDQ